MGLTAGEGDGRMEEEVMGLTAREGDGKIEEETKAKAKGWGDGDGSLARFVRANRPWKGQADKLVPAWSTGVVYGRRRVTLSRMRFRARRLARRGRGEADEDDECLGDGTSAIPVRKGGAEEGSSTGDGGGSSPEGESSHGEEEGEDGNGEEGASPVEAWASDGDGEDVRGVVGLGVALGLAKSGSQRMVALLQAERMDWSAEATALRARVGLLEEERARMSAQLRVAEARAAEDAASAEMAMRALEREIDEAETEHSSLCNAVLHGVKGEGEELAAEDGENLCGRQRAEAALAALLALATSVEDMARTGDVGRRLHRMGGGRGEGLCSAVRRLLEAREVEQREEDGRNAALRRELDEAGAMLAAETQTTHDAGERVRALETAVGQQQAWIIAEKDIARQEMEFVETRVREAIGQAEQEHSRSMAAARREAAAARCEAERMRGEVDRLTSAVEGGRRANAELEALVLSAPSRGVEAEKWVRSLVRDVDVYKQKFLEEREARLRAEERIAHRHVVAPDAHVVAAERAVDEELSAVVQDRMARIRAFAVELSNEVTHRRKEREATRNGVGTA